MKSASLPRQFNSRAEQLAAERRAMVAQAVSKQEWLDREEFKWGPEYVSKQQFRDPGLDEEGDDLEDDFEEPLSPDEGGIGGGANAYMSRAPPPSQRESPLMSKLRENAWLVGVLVFSLFMLGSILVFWDNMHVSREVHRPAIRGAAHLNGDIAHEIAVELEEERELENGGVAQADDEPEGEGDGFEEGGEEEVAEEEEAFAGGEEASEGEEKRHRRLLLTRNKI
eukprot:CAMPEP_0170134610 /NCGR_PEP_ID=MMETSP0033_2-20121228/2007_1 /TAXON_ID=195969 /ORGANISM="Dolichomastix tenuilepis, Strain CCMP3274" /LENGTH=224 /DNA_ID=CAMNT_0010370177 /DNA_START=9 /DNA_END=683 /DNA_ORIENTATION=+